VPPTDGMDGWGRPLFRWTGGRKNFAAIGIDLKSGDPRLAGSDHPHDVDRL